MVSTVAAEHRDDFPSLTCSVSITINHCGSEISVALPAVEQLPPDLHRGRASRPAPRGTPQQPQSADGQVPLAQLQRFLPHAGVSPTGTRPPQCPDHQQDVDTLKFGHLFSSTGVSFVFVFIIVFILYFIYYIFLNIYLFIISLLFLFFIQDLPGHMQLHVHIDSKVQTGDVKWSNR